MLTLGKCVYNQFSLHSHIHPDQGVSCLFCGKKKYKIKIFLTLVESSKMLSFCFNNQKGCNWCYKSLTRRIERKGWVELVVSGGGISLLLKTVACRSIRRDPPAVQWTSAWNSHLIRGAKELSEVKENEMGLGRKRLCGRCAAEENVGWDSANSLMGLKANLLKSISHSEQLPMGFSHGSGSCNSVKQSYSNVEKLLNTGPEFQIIFPQHEWVHWEKIDWYLNDVKPELVFSVEANETKMSFFLYIYFLTFERAYSTFSACLMFTSFLLHHSFCYSL